MSAVFTPCEPVRLPISGLPQWFPVHRVYCVGQNYAAHTREMGGSPEREPPFFFSKPADALTRSDRVPFPPMTSNLHHEVELVVALGSGGREIDISAAEQHIYGYAVGVDLTRRDLQAEAKKKGRPWDVAKGFDNAAPISAVVPAAQCGHPRSGVIRLAVNGDERQRGDLSQMTWSVPEIIAELSRYFELRPGDLIFTGTPAGVSALQPGDRVACEVERVGSLDFSLYKG